MNSVFNSLLEAQVFVRENIVALCRCMELRSAAKVLAHDSAFMRLRKITADINPGDSWALAESMIRNHAVQLIAQQAPKCEHPQAKHHPARLGHVEYWTCRDCGMIWTAPINQETEDAKPDASPAQA